jgi:hypothetical protein
MTDDIFLAQILGHKLLGPNAALSVGQSYLCRGSLKCSDLNSAKAEAKLVKALDYLVAINDNFDNPAQKWVINESILASLTGCFRPAIKKFVETHHSFIKSG